MSNHRICCFGFDVTTSPHPPPARPTTYPKSILRRSSLPRAFPPSPPASTYHHHHHHSPSYCPTPPAHYCLPLTPADTQSTINQAPDAQITADIIAEILAPTTLAMRRIEDTLNDVADNIGDARSGGELAAAAAEPYWVEAEAVRRVRERNKRNELRAMEDGARRRVEGEFRSSGESLVVVGYEGERRERERRERERGSMVVRVETSSNSRRKSTSMEIPRRQVRYVLGV